MLYRYLLVVRFALINAIALGLLGAAYLQGWLDAVLNAHLVELSLIIFLVFLYGLVLCSVRILSYGKELNDIKSGTPSPDSRATFDRPAGSRSRSRRIAARTARYDQIGHATASTWPRGARRA